MKSKVKYNQTCASIHTPNAARVTNTNFFLLETQCSPNHIGKWEEDYMTKEKKAQIPHFDRIHADSRKQQHKQAVKHGFSKDITV